MQENQSKKGEKMNLNKKEQELWDNYKNGNLSIFKNELKKLSKVKLIDFIYNIQEQSLQEANEILSICRKYLTKNE